MPGTDPYARLFKWNLEVPVPGGDIESCLRQLEQTGLVRLREREYVLCAHSRDRKPHWVEEIDCPGRYVIDSGVRESNRDCKCDECSRVLYPSGMQKFRALVSNPDNDAIVRFVQEQFATVGLDATDVRRGLYRVELPSAAIEVCLADSCRWRPIYDENYANAPWVVFLVGDEAGVARRIPRGAVVFYLADLVLGQSLERFRRVLRKLAKAGKQELASGGAPPRRGRGDTEPVPPPSIKQEKWEKSVRMEVKRGTEWEDIHIHYVDGETVAVKAPGYSYVRWTYTDLNMATEKGRKPIRRWFLLVAILEKKGYVPDFRILGYDKDFRPCVTEVSGLRKHLQHVFALDKDPIPRCSQETGIRVDFQAYPDKPGEELYVDPSEWLDR